MQIIFLNKPSTYCSFLLHCLSRKASHQSTDYTSGFIANKIMNTNFEKHKLWWKTEVSEEGQVLVQPHN